MRHWPCTLLCLWAGLTPLSSSPLFNPTATEETGALESAGSVSSSPVSRLRLGRGRELLIHDRSGLPESVSGQSSLTRIAVPRSIASADLDGDGTVDLLCGFAQGDGGFLTLHRGDPAVIGRLGIQSERGGVGPPDDRDPFDREARVLDVGTVPDFLATGDFNADDIQDIVIASKGAEELSFLPGIGNGRFGSIQPVELGGRLREMASGDVNRPDGLTDLVVGTELEAGNRLLIFESPRGALAAGPEQVELPRGSLAGLTLARLVDGPEVDVALGLADQLVILPGRDRMLTLPSRLRAPRPPEPRFFPQASPIFSIAAGNFAGADGPELAILLASAELQILGNRDEVLHVLESRPVGSGRLENPGGAVPRTTQNTRLIALKASTGRYDDLGLLNPSEGDFRIITGLEDASLASAQDSAGNRAEPWPEALYGGSVQVLDLLPIRVNSDGLDDLLILHPTGLRMVPTASGLGLTVNSSGSDYECKQPADPGGRCTIRGALTYINTHPQDAPFEINITVSEITLEATGTGFQDSTYIPPLVVPAPTTINGNGVVIRGVSGAQWGSAASGEKSAAFHLFRYGAKDASNSTIRGVTLDDNGATYGIYVEDVSNVTIEACRFGDQGAIPGGITLINSTGSTVTDNEFHNLTRAGLEILASSSGIQVLNNYFGADKSGAVPASARSGLEIVSPAQACVVQGNEFAGIADAAIEFKRVSGNATGGGHLVQGNTIGLNPGQSNPVPNSVGITNSWHSGCTIGGTTVGLANVIAGNTTAGVRLNVLSDGTRLIGNLIGTNGSGHSGLGNGEDGVVIAGKDLEVGGEGAAGNIIAFNGTTRETAKGVVLAYAGTGNKILGNSIHSNRSLGIGFSSGPDPTPNDDDDSDSGPNNRQNFPILTRVPNSEDLDLTLQSTPNSTFTIQVFANDSCDPSGYGEGETLIDTFELQTVDDGSGLALLQSAPEGKVLTATATDSAGNTSEFSPCAAEVQEVAPFVVNSNGDDPDEDAEESEYDGICSTGKKADGSSGSCSPQVEGDCECTLRAAIQESNATPASNQIHFSISGSSPATIAPGTSLPPLTSPVEIDGTTQPGYSGLPLIELAGSGHGDGLRLVAGSSEVRALVVNRFDTAIAIESDFNIIRGNLIGTCLGGTANLCPSGPGSFDAAANVIGIHVRSGEGNLIGGPRPQSSVCEDPCNVVASSSSDGIALAEGNRVEGNFIGTDRLGKERFSNLNGITILVQESGTPTIIGGSVAGTGNVISSSVEYGIRVLSIFNEVSIQGNLIGTDASGVGNLGNREAGVFYAGGSQSPRFWIGGLDASAGNRISFNKVGIEATRPVIALSNEIFLNERSLSFAYQNPLQIEFGTFYTGPVTVQPQGNGSSGLTSAVWQASTLKEFPKSTPVIVQFFRSGAESPCEAVELIGSFQVYRTGDSEKSWLSRRNAVYGNPLLWDDYLTATITVPDAAQGTSKMAFCQPPYLDSDGDGFHDGLEEGRDSNKDGIDDSLQPNLAVIQSLGKNWTVETNAGALGAAIVLGSFEQGGTMHANGLLDMVLSNLDSPSNGNSDAKVRLQGSAVTVTITPEADPSLLPVYLNYGPTPDNPEPHVYSFSFDGTTGAEFIRDGALITSVVLHFVDGLRGDHDLQENGVIVTRGGLVSHAAQFLYPIHLSSASLFSGVGTSNFSNRNAVLTLTQYAEDGQLSESFANPAFTSVEGDQQEARLTSEIFDYLPADERAGWIRLVSDNEDLGGLLLMGGGRQLDGAVPFEWVYDELYLTRLFEGPQAFHGQPATTLLSLVHPGRVDTTQLPTTLPTQLRIELLRNGSVVASSDYELAQYNALQGSIRDLLGNGVTVNDASDVLRVRVLEGQGLIAAALVRIRNDETFVALNAASAGSSAALFSPQVADLPGVLFTSIKLVNTSEQTRELTLRMVGDSGAPIAAGRTLSLRAQEVAVLDAGDFDYSGENRIGSLRVEADGAGIVGDVLFGDPVRADWAAALPLQSAPFREAVFSQVANIPGVLFTGLALLNPGSEAVSVRIDVHSTSGALTGTTIVDLGPGERISQTLSELVPSTDGQVTGSIRLTSDGGIYAQQLFGDFQATYLSAVPPKVVEESQE